MSDKLHWILLLSLVNAIEPSYEMTTTKFRNQEAVVGETTELECGIESGFDQLKWDFTRLGEDRFITIMDGIKPALSYADRVFPKQNYKYNLVIEHLVKEDAGTYVCRDQNHEHANQMKINLILLETPPVCTSNATDVVVVESNDCDVSPSHIGLSCSVKYHGISPPILIWEEITDHGSNNKTDGQKVSNNVSVIPKWNQNIFTCKTTLYKHPCYIHFQKSQYVFNTSMKTLVEWPHEVTCLANSSQECVYSWTHNNQPFSSDQRLKLTTKDASGKYGCSAECKIQGKPCAVFPLEIDFQPNRDLFDINKMHTIQTALMSFVLGILVLVVILGFLQFTIVQKNVKHWINLITRRTEEEEKDTPKLLIPENEVDSKQQPTKNKPGNKESDPLVNNNANNKQVYKVVKRTGRKAIKGVTILNGKLYVITYAATYIEEYTEDADGNFSHPREIEVLGLVNPGDLVGLTQRYGVHNLYVTDRTKNRVLRITESMTMTRAWSTDTTPDGLSIANEGPDENAYILLACPYENCIKKYTSSGILTQTIQLDKTEIPFPRHVAYLKGGTYLVLYGDINETSSGKYGIRGIAVENELKTAVYPDNQTFCYDKECWPERLAIDAKSKVLVLSFARKSVLEIDPSNNGEERWLFDLEEQPARMIYDTLKKRIYVAEHSGQRRLLIYDYPKPY